MSGNNESLARFKAREKLAAEFPKYQKMFVDTVAQRDRLNIKISQGANDFDTINSRDYYANRSEHFASLTSNLTTLRILQDREKQQAVGISNGKQEYMGDINDREQEKLAKKIREQIASLTKKEHNFKPKKPKLAKMPKPKPPRR